jgi:hypothetical protein
MQVSMVIDSTRHAYTSIGTVNRPPAMLTNMATVNSGHAYSNVVTVSTCHANSARLTISRRGYS